MDATLTHSNPVSSYKLTPRQKKFARFLALGATQTRAYELASPRPINADSAKVQGSLWARSNAIQAEVARLSGLAESDLTLNMRRRRELLSSIANTDPNRPPTHSERIAAIRTDAELSGELKQDTTVNVTLQQVLASLPPAISKATP